MVDEHLTTRQAQYLLQKWKDEAAQTYVAKAGDTMSGKLILGAGLAITSGARETSPSFLLSMDSFADGGTVKYVRTSDMASAIGIGEVSVHNGNSTNVSTAKDTTLCNSGALSSGTYILKARAQFAANTSGRRTIFLSTSSTGSFIDRYTRVQVAPAPSTYTEIELTSITTISSETTYYLRAYQNSGSTLAVTGGIEYVKIRN